MRRVKFAFALALLQLIVACHGLRAAITLDELRCENLVDPQGIDTTHPRLSWILESSGRDVKQSACELLVASSESNLARNKGDLWDSGKILSDQSVLVPYAGQSLISREACFWKVRIWDATGKASAWSKPFVWTMGILTADEWHARWIGQDGADEAPRLADTSWIWSDDASSPTNYFRRVITIPANRHVRRAIFEYTGDNECRGWIGEFDLGARNNFKTVKWNDITTRLESGRTYVFGLTGSHNTNSNDPAGIIGKLTIEFAEGETVTYPTDEKWKVSASPDAGWNSPDFDGSKWATQKILGPAGMEPWGETRVPESRRQPARYLRKEFSVDKSVVRATVSFCGLGLSELYMNGKKVGDAVLSPAFAQYDKRELYVTYDVTKNVQFGANALGVILGNGRFYADRSKVYAGTVSFGWPKLLLNLHIEYADGSFQEIVSDESWKLTTDGPIQANNDYDGEEYEREKN